ncbi:MAG: lipoprotein-releasing system transmembrane subunit LolC, partial [Lysobacteraceae bacterium]
MFKPIPVSIGLRYLRAKRRNGFISFISLASILGIALGVTVLITTLSVMSGFQRGDAMQDWPHALQVALQDKRVAGAAPYVDSQALLKGVRNQPAIVRGVLPSLEGNVSVLAQKMKRGSLESLAPGSFNVVLGQELALWLGVGVGDSVVLMLADERSTPMGAMPSIKRFKVSGVFEAGYNEIDKGLAVVNMSDLQRVLKMGEGVTGVRLRLHDMDQSWEVAGDLAQDLRGPYRISDWTSENANLYSSLKMEKTVMGILLSLIIAMGAFNLVSSQVMLVTDKQADIA